MKRIALVVMIALWTNIMTTYAQDNDGYCNDNRDDLIPLLDTVLNASGDEEILNSLLALRDQITVHLTACATPALEVGYTRLNPIPFGQPGSVNLPNQNPVSITVVDRRVITNDQIRTVSNWGADTVNEGAVATSIVMDVTCLKESIDFCEADLYDFQLVGDSGILLTNHHISFLDTSITMFGGVTQRFSVVFEVDENERDFVLMASVGENAIFFETP